MAQSQSGLEGPKFVRYFGPIVDALKNLGGSARPVGVTDKVAASLNVSDEQQSELTSSGVPPRHRRSAVEQAVDVDGLPPVGQRQAFARR